MYKSKIGLVQHSVEISVFSVYRAYQKCLIQEKDVAYQ